MDHGVIYDAINERRKRLIVCSHRRRRRGQDKTVLSSCLVRVGGVNNPLKHVYGRKADICYLTIYCLPNRMTRDI